MLGRTPVTSGIHSRFSLISTLIFHGQQLNILPVNPSSKMPFSRALLRTSVQSLRPRPGQFRRYATASPQGQQFSQMPMFVPCPSILEAILIQLNRFIGIMTVTAGVGYYMMQSGPENKSHHEKDQFVKGDTIEEKTPAGESSAQPDRDSDQKIAGAGGNRLGYSTTFGQPPSTVDAVRFDHCSRKEKTS